MREQVKLCVGASAGGHMNELLELLRTVDRWPVRPAVYVTTMDILAGELRTRGPVTVIGECDRRRPVKAISVMYRALRFVLRERPDVVLTTGSLPLAIVCAFAKLRGAQIIWIDSIANVERMSVSGRFVRRFADLCLSQWPEVAARYSGVEYAGEVF